MPPRLAPNGLSPEDEALLQAAEAAAASAYCPYSRFHVGAAVRCDDGAVFAAANVENAAFPAGQCAEANAVAAAVSAGHRRIAAVAVVGYPASGGGDALATPCGRCRQIINEFGGADAAVLVRDRARTRLLSTTLGALLPHAFGPEALG